MKYHTKLSLSPKRTSIALGTTAVYLVLAQPLFAASGTIRVAPATGNYQVGASIPVSVTIDGGGDTFNAAKATVALTNLSVTDLTLGDCNFAFVRTPSAADASFEGAILGGSSTKCTVYTATFTPTAAGTGTVALTNGAIITNTSHTNILTSLQGATFTASGNTSQAQTADTDTPTPTQEQGTTIGTTNYTLAIKVADTPPKSNVSLEVPAGKTTTTLATKPVDASGQAVFSNIPKGVYQVTVKDTNGKVLKTNVITVAGENHQLALGVSTKRPSNPVWPWLIIVLIVLAGAGAFIFWRRRESPPTV